MHTMHIPVRTRLSCATHRIASRYASDNWARDETGSRSGTIVSLEIDAAKTSCNVRCVYRKLSFLALCCCMHKYAIFALCVCVGVFVHACVCKCDWVYVH